MNEDNQRLGTVVSGSLNKGVEVRLDAAASIEEMAVGRYVTIAGKKRRFFGMITDISLGVTDQNKGAVIPRLGVKNPLVGGSADRAHPQPLPLHLHLHLREDHRIGKLARQISDEARDHDSRHEP